MPIRNPEHAYREYVPALPQGESFATHHIKAARADISRYCLIPGSHLRGRKIAERLDDCRVISATRGYYVYSGYAEGVFLTVCSTGMGGPAAAIAMEELARLGVDMFVRVGSAGAMQDDLGVGDIAVATALYRAGGTANHFLPEAFPAVANFELSMDMQAAAAELRVPIRFGVCMTSDAFYAPVDPTEDPRLRRAGVLAVEMEADTQYVLGQYNGWRCAAGFVLDGGKAKQIAQSSAENMAIANHADNADFIAGEDALIALSIKALVRCARRDQVGSGV